MRVFHIAQLVSLRTSFVLVTIELLFAGTRAIDGVDTTTGGTGVPAWLAIMFRIGARQEFKEGETNKARE
jgi:hypothetical protein